MHLRENTGQVSAYIRVYLVQSSTEINVVFVCLFVFLEEIVALSVLCIATNLCSQLFIFLQGILP